MRLRPSYAIRGLSPRFFSSPELKKGVKKNCRCEAGGRAAESGGRAAESGGRNADEKKESD